jgi:hypothetical protein
MTKTEWYPARIKPVRNGLYETRVNSSSWPVWSVWTGKHWSKPSTDPEWAASNLCRGESFWQNREWRGLTEPAA